jgi:glyoxylase-like metal-dependent hydrolase (beta-lactamase superfamily II)
MRSERGCANVIDASCDSVFVCGCCGCAAIKQARSSYSPSWRHTMTNPGAPSTRPPYLRGEWGTAAWIDEHVCRVRLKNTLGTLMVNTIVYRDDQVLLVIDPGWPWTLDALAQALRELGVIERTLGEVDHFLYTHTHIDHMGGAALLSAQFDTPHHYFEDLKGYTPSWHAFQDRLGFWDEWMIQIVSGAHRAQVMNQLKARGPRKTMTDTYGAMSVQHGRTFGLGDRLQFGALELDVHDASGHDPHHVAFLDPHRAMLISGDAALAIPTPITGVMGDDLARYEATLDRLEALEANMLLPGHGTQVIGQERVRAHIQKSRGFVTHYAQAVRAYLAARREPVGLWPIAEALAPDERIIHQTVRWWAHMGLIQARLERMVELGEVQCIIDDDGPLYHSRTTA